MILAHVASFVVVTLPGQFGTVVNSVVSLLSFPYSVPTSNPPTIPATTLYITAVNGAADGAEEPVHDRQKDDRADAEKSSHPHRHIDCCSLVEPCAAYPEKREENAEDETPDRIERGEHLGQGPDTDVTNDHAGSFEGRWDGKVCRHDSRSDKKRRPGKSRAPFD